MTDCQAKLILALLLSAGFLMSQTSIEGNVLDLSLGEALGRIEDENLQALLSWESVEEALQISKRERAALLPQVTLEMSQSRTQFVNVGRGVGGPAVFPPGSRFESKLTGIVPLIDPVNFASWRLALHGHEVSKFNHQTTLQELLNILATAYFTHQRNLKRTDVMDADIKRDLLLLDLAQSQFDGGIATRIDVTRAKVQLASDQKARIRQDTVVMGTDLLIKRLLNLSIDTELNLDSVSTHHELKLSDFDSTFADILKIRPDYLKLQRELKRNELARKAAAWESLPTVGIFGEWGYASEEALDNQEENLWTAGIGLTLPIFEGLRVRSNKLRADALIRAKRYELQDLENQVESEYILAQLDLLSRLAQIDITQKKYDLSGEEFGLAKMRFTNGIADNRDVVDAQSNLASASDELVEAVHQYNLSRLELARIRGDVRLIIND